MSEFITIQVGQCGNQIGSAFWPLALQEHGIQCDLSDAPKRTGSGAVSKQNHNSRTDALHSFFWSPKMDGNNFRTLSDLGEHKVKARAICIDMEDSVVARFRTGPLRHLFDSKCLLTNYPGSGNNWAEGYYTHGGQYRGKIVDMVRQAAERCDSLHGFLMLFSLGGGTGSGLGTATLRLLEDYFPNVERFVTCVYPASSEDVIISPYNVALATRELSEHASVVFPVDNRALMDICSRTASHVHVHNDRRRFVDINSVVVDMLLHLTSGARFAGRLNMDMSELTTNMVPYPRTHYIASGVSPFTSDSAWQRSIKPEEIFSSAWSRDHQLLKINPLGGLVLGATLLARGAVSWSDVRRSVERFEAKARFAPWNLNAVKVGLCAVPPLGVTTSLLCLVNTASISALFQDALDKFKRLYRRKAHMHHYLQVNGCEESHFEESRDNLLETVLRYKELDLCTPLRRPRLKPL